jgi:hypothetical protein
MWDQKDMEAAMKAVQEEGMTVSGTAKQFMVPRTTLDDRSRVKYSMVVALVHQLPLTAEDESALAAYLYMAEHGFPLTSNMAIGFAWEISLRSSTQERFNPETGPGRYALVAKLPFTPSLAHSPHGRLVELML